MRVCYFDVDIEVGLQHLRNTGIVGATLPDVQDSLHLHLRLISLIGFGDRLRPCDRRGSLLFIVKPRCEWQQPQF